VLIAERPSLFAVKGLLVFVAVLGLATFLWMFSENTSKIWRKAWEGNFPCMQKTRRKKDGKNVGGNGQRAGQKCLRRSRSLPSLVTVSAGTTAAPMNMGMIFASASQSHMSINGNDIPLQERHSAARVASIGSLASGLSHSVDSNMSMQPHERRHLEKLCGKTSEIRSHDVSTKKKRSKRDFFGGKMRTRRRRRRVSASVAETNSESYAGHSSEVSIASGISSILARVDAKLASRACRKVEPENEVRPGIGTMAVTQASVQTSCTDLSVLGSMATSRTVGIQFPEVTAAKSEESASASVSTSSSLPSSTCISHQITPQLTSADNGQPLHCSIHNQGRRGALADIYQGMSNASQITVNTSSS